MRKKSLAVFLFLPLVLASFLQSQSLADLAKKEKERRAALKGKAATVITTADLAKVKKRPAVESTGQEQAAEEGAEAAEGQAKEGVAPPATGEQAAGAAAQVEKPAEETPPAEPRRRIRRRTSRRSRTSWPRPPSRRPIWSTF